MKNFQRRYTTIHVGRFEGTAELIPDGSLDLRLHDDFGGVTTILGAPQDVVAFLEEALAAAGRALADAEAVTA